MITKGESGTAEEWDNNSEEFRSSSFLKMTTQLRNSIAVIQQIKDHLN